MTWIGDHKPRHVHVYQDDVLVVKWNLETNSAMQGRASSRIRKLITSLRQEGLL